MGIGLFVVVGCGIAVGAIYGNGARMFVWAVLLLVLLTALYRTKLDVVVDAAGVSLGNAHLPWKYIERIEVLTGPDFRAALTTGAHPTDYLRIRSMKSGMRVWLHDPTDPHRAWVTSIKRPADLSQVLGVAA